jgi:AraC-like DNA-binding protein
MLAATSDLTYGSSRYRAALTLERRFRAYLVVRERLAFDTRFAAPGLGGACATLYLLLGGAFQRADGPVVRPPVAFMLAESELERIEPGAPTFRTWGDPAITFELRVALDDVRAPVGLGHGPLALSAATWSALQQAHDAFVAGDGPEPTTASLVRCLVDDGVLAGDVADSITPTEPEAIARVWSGVKSMFAQHATSMSLDELASATGVCERQLRRDVKLLTHNFGLPGDGFREAMKFFRLRTAVILLSSPDATATDVARQVGYQSLEAMGRAFRDSNLPAPSVVRDQVRYERMIR